MISSYNKKVSENDTWRSSSQITPLRAEYCFSQRVLDRLEAIYEGVRPMCADLTALRRTLVAVTCELSFNELELAAWGCLLQKTLRRAAPCDCIQQVALTAYHAKALLSRSAGALAPFLQSQSPEFQSLYAQRSFCPEVQSLSLKEVHKEYMKTPMVRRPVPDPASLGSESVMKVMYDLLDAESEPECDGILFTEEYYHDSVMCHQLLAVTEVETFMSGEDALMESILMEM